MILGVMIKVIICDTDNTEGNSNYDINSGTANDTTDSSSSSR